jgi:hypothetical protein
MIPRDRLPEDAADWRTIGISFPRLPQDTTHSCPMKVKQIMEYVRMESADLDDADPARLAFVRTARVEDMSCWLWTYTEGDGQVNFVLFERRDDGRERLGLTESNGLSPEQYLLAAYYDEIYWS